MFRLPQLKNSTEYVQWLEENVDAEKMRQCQRLVDAFNKEYLTAKYALCVRAYVRVCARVCAVCYRAFSLAWPMCPALLMVQAQA